MWTAWGGAELKAFRDVLAPFESSQNIKVHITTNRDSTNQIANGRHSFNKIPWILSVGKNTTYLKKGQFLDIGSATTNQMLNTLLNAAGVRKSGGAVVDDFGDSSLAKGVISAIVA